MCICTNDDGSECGHLYQLTAKKKPYDPIPTDVKLDTNLHTQFESSKVSQHMLKMHGVMSKRKRGRDSAAISAVALGGPASKRMRAVMSRVGPLDSPASGATSASSAVLPIQAAYASRLVAPLRDAISEAASQANSQANSQAPSQAASSPGQLKFATCSKCNPNAETRKARQADQRARLMRFYVYADQKISGTLLTGPEFRDVCEGGDPKYAKLGRDQCRGWIKLENSLAKFLLKHAIEKCRELHKGNPFAQHQHDGVTLPNRRKYFANGHQMVFDFINWTLCQGFPRAEGSTADEIKPTILKLWSPVNMSMDDFASKIQDFADLKVARVMGFEEEGCQMHSEDKVGASATGTLT